MPVNGYTVGKDVSIDITGPNGPVRFSVKTGFSAKQDTNDTKVKRLDGVTDHVLTYDGWTGTLDFERQSSALDDYFAQQEANYFAGVNSLPISITETTTEADGSVSQFRYTSVVLKYDDSGSKTGDATVKQKVSWMASRRIKVA